MATAAFWSGTRRSTFVDAATGDASSNRDARLSFAQGALAATPIPSRRHRHCRTMKSPRGRCKEDDVIKADIYRRRGRSVSRCIELLAARECKGFSENGDKNRGTSCARLRRQRSASMTR